MRFLRTEARGPVRVGVARDFAMDLVGGTDGLRETAEVLCLEEIMSVEFAGCFGFRPRTIEGRGVGCDEATCWADMVGV